MPNAKENERGRIIAEFGDGSRVELGSWLIGREWSEVTLIVLDESNHEKVRRYYRLRGTSLWPPLVQGSQVSQPATASGSQTPKKMETGEQNG